MAEAEEEGIPVKIQFEFLNAFEEMELSKEYTVKIDPKDEFEPNRINMINSCDFRTQEERIYYYMFDRNKKIFLPSTTDLAKLCKSNKVIIMENCKTFSEQVCEKLREDALTYKNNENDTSGQDESKKNVVNESKKNEIRLLLCYLSSNFEVDLFAEEFIMNNGIQYLDTIMRYNKGNIRTYALQSISKLLDYQSAYDYFEKKKEILSSLYNILMTDGNINCAHFSLDLMIKIIRTSEEKTMYIIDVAEKYAKKTHTKIFSQIVNNLSETNKEIKLKVLTLMFINTIMNYCHPSKLPRILIQLRDVEIFEFLDKRKKQDEKFEEQVNIFIKKADSVLSDTDYEVEIYKKEIEDMKTHCFEIEKKYMSFTENSEHYEYIINDFVKYLNISECIINQAGVTDPKAPKEAMDNNLNMKYSVDSHGLVEYQKLIEEEDKKDLDEINEKYSMLEKQYEKLKKRYKDLGGDGGDIKNDQILELEKKLKEESDEELTIRKKREEFENKVRLLEEKISLRGSIVPSAPAATPHPHPHLHPRHQVQFLPHPHLLASQVDLLPLHPHLERLYHLGLLELLEGLY